MFLFCDDVKSKNQREAVFDMIYFEQYISVIVITILRLSQNKAVVKKF